MNSRRSSSNRASLSVGALLVLAATLGVWAFVSRERAPDEHRVTTRPAQIVGDGYVSSGTCKACHPSQYESWHRSFHRTMTQVATPETVVPDFSGRVVDAVEGRPMMLQRAGRQFWAEFDDPDWTGRGVPSRLRRQVVLTTGSHQQQVFWYQSDKQRQLGQLPGTYLLREKMWVPREAVFLTPPTSSPISVTGRWDNVCIHCHTTEGKSAEYAKPGVAAQGTPPRSEAAEFGIACEACHGPGEYHARLNRNPLRRYVSHLTGRPDPTTVQPVRVDPQRSSQVCGQCHGIWFYDDRTTGKPANVATLLYRPGDDIHQTRFLVRPSVDTDSPTMRRVVAENPNYLLSVFWPDGMARVSGREFNGLVDSPCFAQATDPQRTLACFSCHTLHKADDDRRTTANWADTHQVTEGKEGNDACLSCHPAIAAKLTAHTRHKEGSSGSSCYNCHMPYTTYGLLRALRSHRISSPSVSESLQVGRPNACNACHLDKSLGWTSRHLADWYGQPVPELSDDQQQIAASLLWLLRGDAGQRALMTWAMGWDAAQQASGTGWMAGYLAGVLDDDYAAIRLIGYRNLRTLPGFQQFANNAVGPKAAQREDILQAMRMWRSQGHTPSDSDAGLLLNADGSFKIDVVQRLVATRDNRPVRLNE